ncbi:MAG TPA: hypothetical protein VFA52_02945 [Candidatus Paceibacterota bacterium]|nr:hypothetical protein [Candidatus Paceibacterota bacterium]
MKSPLKRADQVIRPCPNGVVGPLIRNCRVRRNWADQHSGKYDNIIAFYNCGRSLYYDPRFQKPNSFYDQPWHWIKFLDHQKESQILTSYALFAGFLRHQVRFQHLGHDEETRTACIMIGSRWNGREYVLDRKLVIPKLCILYVVIHLGHYRSSLLEFQPLPMRLMSREEKVAAYPEQRIVAVK